MRFLCLTAVILTLGSAAQARTYEGREAVALRCANMLALTGIALNGTEQISDDEKNVFLGVTISILEGHVSGTWRQKKAAMAVMRDRRSIPDTLDDYRRNAAKCLQQFPIN